MGVTEPTEVRDAGPPALPKPPELSPKGRPTPPAGLPHPPGSPGALSTGTLKGPERIEFSPPPPHEPTTFLRRHEIGILRGIAVVAVIVFLLLLWQGVAHGEGAG